MRQGHSTVQSEKLLFKALEHGILAEVLFGKLTGQTAALGPQLGAFNQLPQGIRKGSGIAGWHTAPGVTGQQGQFTALR